MADCYRNSLKLAVEKGIRTIAFPAISTGVYGYPLEMAARTSIRTVRKFLADHPGSLDKVVFVLFSDHARKVFEKEAAHWDENIS